MLGDVIFSLIMGSGVVLCLFLAGRAIWMMNFDPDKADETNAPIAMIFCLPCSVFPFINLLVGVFVGIMVLKHERLWRARHG